MVFPHCLLHDLSLFCGGNKSVIYPQRNAVSVRKVSKYSRFFRTWRILRHRPAGLVEVSADVVVGVKADHARHGAVEKVLCFHYLKLLIRQFFFLLLFSSHLFSPPNQIRFLPRYRVSHRLKYSFRNTKLAYV